MNPLQALAYAWITRLTYWLTRRQTRLAQPVMRWFVRRYQVNLDEAAEPDLQAYGSFNAFFTRALKAEARPLLPSPQQLLCPVDGTVATAQQLDGNTVIHAKGRGYTIDALLAESGACFYQGSLANIYLSPRDYHRIHLPCDATLLRMHYVPGLLHSVSPATAARVPDLFALNERVVCLWQSPAFGRIATVFVGAVNVAAMETPWHGAIARSTQMQSWSYSAEEHCLAQGAEIGRFNLGSTVILLSEKPVYWDQLSPGDSVRLFQPLNPL